MKLKLDDGEQEGFSILCEAIPTDLAEDIVRLRRRKKAHLTKRIASRLVTEYRAYGDPEKAAEIHLMRGWISFENSWVQKHVHQPSRQPMPTPFQQRHRNAIDAFDRALGVQVNDQPSLYDYDMPATDWRTH